MILPENIETYARQHSSPVDPLFEELRQYTQEHTDLPQMQVGPLEGNFLKLLAGLISARRIVEVGTFTGYSSLMMASGMHEEGHLTTCELSEKHANIARTFFDKSPFGDRIEIRLGPAADTLASLEGPFDMAFIDADKGGYITYFDLIYPKMRDGGLIIVDNVLWSGKVLDDPERQEESTQAISAFNRHVAKHTAHKVMLTVRDGMTLIHK